jgi:hypothetical protein
MMRSFNRAYEVKSRRAQRRITFSDMVMTQRICSFRGSRSGFDPRIPVVAIPLNLADPDLKEMKPDVNGEKPAFGDIYFYSEQFNSAGYFYKVLRAAPKFTTGVKIYGQEYEDDFYRRSAARSDDQRSQFYK